MSMILIRKSLDKTHKGWKRCGDSRMQREETGVKLLLVEKRLDQLGASRDVRLGRGQEGAWRQKNR